MVDVAPIIAAVLSGIGLGLIMSLVAVAFFLVFDALDILNIAHGLYIIFAAYTVRWLVLADISIYLAAPVAIAGSGAIGYGVQRFLFTPLIRYIDDVGKEIIIVASFGLVVVFEQMWGNLTQYAPISNSFPLPIPGFSIGASSVDTMAIVFGGFSLILVLAFHYFMKNTITGRSIQTVDQSEFGARISGFHPSRMYNLTHLICGLLAGIAGVLLSFVRPVATTEIISWTVMAFIVVMIGAIISQKRTIPSLLWAGPVVGIFITVLGRFGYSRWVDFATFAVLLVVILAVNYSSIGQKEAVL